MIEKQCLSRRELLTRSGAAGVGLALASGWSLLPDWVHAADSTPELPKAIQGIQDAEIRAGMQAAILKNMIPAAVETDYPGYFWISADGQAYGNATWPGLDSWQMAGTYLLLGRTRMVLDYFDFVRASQRKDGHIPFAIFPGDTKPGGCLSGLKSPEDIYTYTPPKREGLPESSQKPRTWIGLFKHWHPKDPLGALAPVCYVLTAGEIFDVAGSTPWLRETALARKSCKIRARPQKRERFDRRGGLLSRIAVTVPMGRRNSMLRHPCLPRIGAAFCRGWRRNRPIDLVRPCRQVARCLLFGLLAQIISASTFTPSAGSWTLTD